MYLTETLKNTIEVLNAIYDKCSGQPYGLMLLQHVLKLAWDLFKSGCVYIITFQWINDFIKLPIIIPHESNSILADHIFSPSLSFFPLEDNNNNFLSGFLNCFFLYFPLAPVQFIWLRRVIIDGPWAGFAATIGIIIGNLSLLGFCLFGFRDIINIWFGLEPLSYFLGIYLIFIVIFQMTQKPLKIIRKYQKKELFGICVINFALVWTDQPGLYQFFGNLSLQTGISPLDIDFSATYFSGVILGSFFWAPLIGFGLLQLGYLFPRITKYPYSVWIRSLNIFCLIGCITLALTSFPYYGFDYLFANPLGFVPQDKVWEDIGLPLLKTDTSDANKGRLGEKSSYTSVDTDLSLFDRGFYGGGPGVELNIEALNYKKEYAWRSRFDRLSSRYLTRGGGFLAKYFTDIDEDFDFTETDKKTVVPKGYSSGLTGAEDLNGSGQTQKQHRSFGFQKAIEHREAMLEEEDSYSDSEAEIEYFFDNIDEEDLDEEDLKDLIERFIEDYAAEANTEDTEVPDLPDEQMIKYSAFSEIAKYGFDFFSMFEAVEVDPLDQLLAADLKQKYSTNFLYRFLVHFDITNFLKRQPLLHKLTSEEEISLFENRLALGEYYNTLRSYSKLGETNQSLFCGPKSYVNRIYNQQFKGTLKIVERLFAIHLENEENIPKLPEWESNLNLNRFSTLDRDSSVLKFDQPLYKTEKTFSYNHDQINEQEGVEDSFLQETASLPFFAGWDNEQRKFIITNRLLTHQTSPLLKTEIAPNSQFFTTWPVSEDMLRNSQEFSRLFRTREDSSPSTDDLFKYTEPLMEEETIIYEKLPNIIQRVELKNTEKLQKSLAPTRGGFIWPGNEPLKFQFKINIFEKISNTFSFWTGSSSQVATKKGKVNKPPRP
uniref:Ycf1 n=1 Tax=Halimeda micronesica TaxID=170426 RepID=A0A386AXF6_9CHLO|nr:hypothetical protein Ycf1 [Halimeda micronesica]